MDIDKSNPQVLNHIADIAEEMREAIATIDIIQRSELDENSNKMALRCGVRSAYAAMEKLDNIFNSI